MFEKFKKDLHRFIHATGGMIDDVTTMEELSRDSWKFIEGERSVIIEAERGQNPRYLIYADSIKRWLPPHDNEEIDSAERARILRKACQFFDERKETYRIEGE